MLILLVFIAFVMLIGCRRGVAPARVRCHGLLGKPAPKVPRSSWGAADSPIDRHAARDAGDTAVPSSTVTNVMESSLGVLPIAVPTGMDLLVTVAVLLWLISTAVKLVVGGARLLLCMLVVVVLLGAVTVTLHVLTIVAVLAVATISFVFVFIIAALLVTVVLSPLGLTVVATRFMVAGGVSRHRRRALGGRGSAGGRRSMNGRWGMRGRRDMRRRHGIVQRL